LSAALTSRRAVLGVADQLLSSGTNYLTAFIASVVLAPDAFGYFVVAYAVVTIYSAAVRAFVGEPMLVHLPTLDDDADEARRLVRSALGTAAALGVVGGLLAFAVGALVGGPLVWLTVFALWLPGALVADAGRYVCFARAEPGRALAIDAAWTVAQAVALVGTALLGSWTVGALAAAWGVGALAGVAVLPLLDLGRPSDPRPWLRGTRYLSGWFTGVSIIGQSQVYVVLLLTGLLLAPVDAAGLRAVQLLVYQPPVTFMAAVLVLLTPVFARRAAAGDRPGLDRARTLSLAAMAGLGLVVLVAIPFRDDLLGLLFPRYTAFTDLVIPVAIQCALAGLTVAFHARLRGLARARALFGVQLVVTASVLGGALLGLLVAGVTGLAWGMAIAGALSLVVMAVVAERAPLPRTTTPEVPVP
jgi:O-antigen/teichoic acid export membrane protein